MYAFTTVASLALVLASRVHAGVYVTNPVQSSSCAGGQSCEVDWVDDGLSPVLSSIGECEVALYTGEFVLAQSLPAVDVSTTSTFTFTVDPNAGPNGQYYLVFSAESISYTGFSGSFTLTGMTGTTPGGGSSTPTATATNSSTPTDTTTTSPPDSNTSTPTGTSTPVTGTTTPTGSTPVDTTATGTATASVTAPTTTGTGTATSPTTTTATTTKATTTSASPTTTNAAGRVGSSSSLGGVAALLVLSGVLAF